MGDMGMKGIVSALGMNLDGILAAGTFSRWVGLYDGYGRGGTRGVFEIRGSEYVTRDDWAGTGVTQLCWSTCGRYLCVVERESDGTGVWDVRVSGRRLSWLQGRRGMTNQRLEAGLFGREFWAGGTDGCVRIWEGLGKNEGDVDPAWQFRAHEGIFASLLFLLTSLVLTSEYLCIDVVCASVFHPSGSVLATCSGQRHRSQGVSDSESESEIKSDDDEMSSSTFSSSSSTSSSDKSSCISFSSASRGASDNSLKIWSL